MLRRILGPRNDKMTGSGGNYRIKKNLYCSPNIQVITLRRMVGTCSTNGGEEKCRECFGGET